MPQDPFMDSQRFAQQSAQQSAEAARQAAQRSQESARQASDMARLAQQGQDASAQDRSTHSSRGRSIALVLFLVAVVVMLYIASSGLRM